MIANVECIALVVLVSRMWCCPGVCSAVVLLRLFDLLSSLIVYKAIAFTAVAATRVATQADITAAATMLAATAAAV